MNIPYIYVVNESTATYASGASIALGSTIHGSYRNIISASGNYITIADRFRGAISGNVSISAAGANAGVISAQLYKDGIAVPGATSIATVAAGGAATLAFPFCIRKGCCANASNLSVVVSSTAGGNIQVSNSSIMAGAM